jgi:hypothetical protein
VTHLTSAALAAWALVTFRQPAPRKSLPPMADTSSGGYSDRWDAGRREKNIETCPF